MSAAWATDKAIRATAAKINPRTMAKQCCLRRILGPTIHPVNSRLHTGEARETIHLHSASRAASQLRVDVVNVQNSLDVTRIDVAGPL